MCLDDLEHKIYTNMVIIKDTFILLTLLRNTAKS